jgi:CDP-diacylglycerol---glycerol-3-phosphate 3-phosphatidyltransferase
VFTARFQAWVRRNALRLARVIGKLPVTPNMVTVAGMLVTFVAAALVGLGYLLPGAIVLAFAGTFDILDGALARATKRSYPYGAFLDSTTDRCSEAATYMGIAAYFLYHSPHQVLMKGAGIACLVALAGSLLVSYVRARAQSLGFTCDGGLFARPERVVITVVGLILGSWFDDTWLAIVVAGLAVVTSLTALQRINEVWQQARRERHTRDAAAKPPSGREHTVPR